MPGLVCDALSAGIAHQEPVFHLLNRDGTLRVSHGRPRIARRPDRIPHGAHPAETQACGVITCQGGGIIDAHPQRLGESVPARHIVFQGSVDCDGHGVLSLIDPANLVPRMYRQGIGSDRIFDHDILHHACLRSRIHF